MLRVSNGVGADDGRVVENEGKKTSGALIEARQGLAIAVRISPPNPWLHTFTALLLHDEQLSPVRDLHPTLTQLQHLN